MNCPYVWSANSPHCGRCGRTAMEHIGGAVTGNQAPALLLPVLTEPPNPNQATLDALESASAHLDVVIARTLHASELYKRGFARLNLDRAQINLYSVRSHLEQVISTLKRKP
jgi:hypothetical protein